MTRKRGGKVVTMLLKLPRDVRDQLSVGDVVVPIARQSGEQGLKLEMELRKRLSQLGLYAGVEYRVVGMEVRQDEGGQPQPEDNQTVKSLQGLSDTERERLEVRLRPVYKLSKRYERPWPIVVPFSTLPVLLQPRMYNTATLMASLTFSLTVLALGLVGRNVMSLSYVVSHSMELTIQAGDLLVVDRVSHHFASPSRGDLLAFNPPPALKEVVRRRGEDLRDNQVFFKRVGCQSGDHALLGVDGLVCRTPEEDIIAPRKVSTTLLSPTIIRTVAGDESLAQPQDVAVPQDGSIYVVGDNPEVSVDSRVWGCVSKQDVVGRPVFRVLPLSRFGPLQ